MLNLTQLSKYKENNRIEAKKAQGGLLSMALYILFLVNVKSRSHCC